MTADPLIRLTDWRNRRIAGTLRMTLPKGISIVVYDGLRSLQTQKEIADRFAAALTNTPMSDDDRAATISRFVTPLPADGRGILVGTAGALHGCRRRCRPCCRRWHS